MQNVKISTLINNSFPDIRTLKTAVTTTVYFMKV